MNNLDKIIESILFVAGDGVDFFDISEKLDINTDEVQQACENLKNFYKENASGIQLLIYNNKAQLCSNSNHAKEVAEVLNPIKEKALTKTVLEAVAIIAYKQPITRLEIEQVRGVNSDYAINILLENNLIEVVGRKDAIGKPVLFGTTEDFLKRFNLSSLTDLPDYDQLLERLEVLQTRDTLFDFSNMPDEEPIDSEEGKEEGSDTETTVAELLDALEEDDDDAFKENA